MTGTVVFLVVMIVLSLFNLIFPRRGFTFGRRWKYENPDDVRPSPAYVAYIRFVSALSLVVLLGILTFLVWGPWDHS